MDVVGYTFSFNLPAFSLCMSESDKLRDNPGDRNAGSDITLFSFNAG